MPLPFTKGEINRLGDRLMSCEVPTASDLSDLASVWASYQDVLELVKSHLASLGFSPTGRVKTTKTMLDKLRRTPGMDLSRMQDLAGARVVVEDLVEQDHAREKICNFYKTQGCSVRVVDRRADPRFGYRAVHLIVTIDGMPVEMQIRTQLQDTWAQIVERLADRWGRGIRYGQDPEDPESPVRSGDSLVATRREAVTFLMTLSDAIAGVESDKLATLQVREQVDASADMLLQKKLRGSKFRATRRKLSRKIQVDMVPVREGIAESLQHASDDLSDEARQLVELGDSITGSQLVRLAQLTQVAWMRRLTDQAETLRSAEDRLRDILRVLAEARDEGA